VRLLRGGELTHTVDIAAEAPAACVLGGADGRTLVICVASEHERDAVLRVPQARIDAVRAPVDGSGRFLTTSIKGLRTLALAGQRVPPYAGPGRTVRHFGARRRSSISQ
jgi:hypothetical protein